MLSVDYQGKILVVKLTGESSKEQIAESEELLDQKLEGDDDARVLLDLRRYDGASDLGTTWQELRLVKIYGDRVKKIAVLGSLDWQKLATLLVSPFTHATERFFEPDEIHAALEWLRQ